MKKIIYVLGPNETCLLGQGMAEGDSGSECNVWGGSEGWDSMAV